MMSGERSDAGREYQQQPHRPWEKGSSSYHGKVFMALTGQSRAKNFEGNGLFERYGW